MDDLNEAGRSDGVAAAVELIAARGPDPGGVWRHRKGGVYRVLVNAVREHDLVPVVVYREEFPRGLSSDRRLAMVWVRPLTEFTDGRFTMVAPARREGTENG
ncbi:MAG TPA: DUF1653 domain-containing protein [Gemmata sp.]|jgi:hypothetical protein|nr:DUF1653 domain-containing protein [Gemmata sp.]